MTQQSENPDQVSEREDLHALALAMKKLTSEDGPILAAVKFMRESNELTRESNRISQTNQVTIRIMLVGFLIVLFLFGVLVYAVWGVLKRVDELNSHLDQTMLQIEAVQKTADNATVKIEEVRVATDAVSDAKAAEPRVEIVPETDPKKIVRAPVKVRITPAPKPSASAVASVVEFPVMIREGTRVPGSSSVSP